MGHETTGERSSPDTASGGGASGSRTSGHDASESPARRRIIATLVYDSDYRPHARAPRVVARWRRRLLYQAGTIEVDLEIGPSKIAGRLRLLGQVTTGEPSVTQVRVTVEGPSGHLQSETDDVGQFLLDRLLAGDHRLAIDLAHGVIAIPWVPLRPRFPLDADGRV